MVGTTYKKWDSNNNPHLKHCHFLSPPCALDRAQRSEWDRTVARLLRGMGQVKSLMLPCKSVIAANEQFKMHYLSARKVETSFTHFDLSEAGVHQNLI